MQPPLAQEESSGQRPAQAECREELGRRAGTPPVALAGAQAQDPAGPRRPWDLDVGLAWVGVGPLYAPRELHCMTHTPLSVCVLLGGVCVSLEEVKRGFPGVLLVSAWARAGAASLGSHLVPRPLRPLVSPPLCHCLLPQPWGALEAAPTLGLRWTGPLVVAVRWRRPGS